MIHVFLNSAPHHVETALILLSLNQRKNAIYFSRNPTYRSDLLGSMKNITDSRLSLFKLLYKSRDKHIVFHGLYDSTFIWLFLILRFKKTIAVHFWGADLYLPKKRTLRRIYITISRTINFRLINCFMGLECDYEYFKTKYGGKSLFIFQTFPSQMRRKDLIGWRKSSIKKSNNKQFNILVGNSADDENNYIEILPYLESAQRVNDLTFNIVLGYGGTQSYKEKVVAAYKRKLKNVTFLLNKLPSSEYHELVQGSDIIIMGHLRQQGVGSITLGLFKNKKIVLRNGNPLLSEFRKLDCTVFTLENLDVERHRIFKKEDIELASLEKISVFTIEGAKELWEQNFSLVDKL